jgi:hypothetical protein
MENREIENRIEWIHSRKALDDMQKSYIRFHMIEQSKQLLDEIELLNNINVKLNDNNIKLLDEIERLKLDLSNEQKRVELLREDSDRNDETITQLQNLHKQNIH